MVQNLEKIPEPSRPMVQKALESCLQKGSLGGVPIDFLEIQTFLSGGKTGAVVLVAKYGTSGLHKLKKKTLPKKSKPPIESVSKGSEFVRVLKVAKQEVCLLEQEGFLITQEKQFDLFSQVDYVPGDEFEWAKERFGILLYQDVGTLSAGDLKGVAGFLTKQVFSGRKESERFGKELSLLLQKEVFYGLKKGMYGSVRKKELNFSDVYGKKLSDSVRKGYEEVRKFDPELPDFRELGSFFQHKGTHHQVSFIHGDLNPENLLVWETELGMKCKIIDFGEMIHKKQEGFTPLFWDFTRLLCEMILNYFEDMARNSDPSGKESTTYYQTHFEEFKKVLHQSFGLEGKMHSSVDSKIGLIANFYLSCFYDFLKEAKSGLMPSYTTELIRDAFYSQICFLLFYSKFSGENVAKRWFGIQLALFLKDYVQSEDFLHSRLLDSLEKFYFQYLSDLKVKKVFRKKIDRSPFMGLSYFTEKDREFFFGRETIVETILQTIEKTPFVSLSGASGSGKSSVVHAGILPILREKNWKVFTFRPGSKPYHSAAKALGRSEDLIDSLRSYLEEDTRIVLLLGDQFEEIFTLCERPEDRENLGSSLLEICKEYPDRFRFLLTIRADFWARFLEEPGFGKIVGDSGEYRKLGFSYTLAPMSVEELRRAIEKPIEVAGLEIQEGLTDLILSQISRETGSLPLLEFCLEELYKRAQEGVLTYSAYKEIGEVKGALATYADQTYSSLSSKEQEMLRKLLLQLIRPGQGTEDTRRIALLEELKSVLRSVSNQDSTTFIQKLTSLRLITTGVNESGKETIEVVHEALIREWKRLREWMGIDREFRVWQERVRASEREWKEREKDSSLLLRGSSLQIAEEWLDTRRLDLGEREIQFIKISISRERRTKILVGSGIFLVLILILGFGTFGMVQYYRASEEHAKAEKALEEAKKAEAIAQREKEEAERQTKIAEQERERAEKERIESDEANRKAEIEKQNAIEERKKAEIAKQEAETAKQNSQKLLSENQKVYQSISKSFNLKPEEMEKAKDPMNWSDRTIGTTDFKTAKLNCIKRKMRLPKEGEMKIALENGLLDTWTPRGFYWIASHKGNLKIFDLEKGKINQPEENKTYPFRCIQN
ncbi:MAG: hypothetical protein H7A24_17105 [Leptospiraceae bacterium]|nr:hypothetical protein [Leptospiraceae bacterium]